MTHTLNVMFAVLVVAPVPFVITIEIEPADGVILPIDKADAVVAPYHLRSITVDAPVTTEFDMTKVCVAPAAILTPLKVTCIKRPLAV
jgi:hypothetical protein